MPATPEEILQQLENERRTVAYDAYDIIVRQLIDMVASGEIDIAPEYQRQFVWREPRESELIESILLGIPVPSLYMAVNPADGSWEVVDGVQRLSTILHFRGEAAHLQKINRQEPLRLVDLTKLTSFNELTFAELPQVVRTGFLNRPMRVTTLNDRSDVNVRFDLFERLNTGGIGLHQQEIRNIVYRGEFKNILRRLSVSEDLREILKLPRGTRDAETSAEYEEAVLRFFAFLDRYTEFDHIVKDFLNQYMQDNATTGPGQPLIDLFDRTVAFVHAELPHGIIRGRRSTPIALYEAVMVGTALVLQAGSSPREGVLPTLLGREDLRAVTTEGTNTRTRVRQRIEIVRDALTA